MLVRVTHSIDYRFDQRVELTELALRLSPRGEQAGVRHHQVLVEPAPAEIQEGRDAFENVVLRARIASITAALDIHALTTVEVGAPSMATDEEAELALLLGTTSPVKRQRPAGLCRRLSEEAALVATGRGFACRFVSGYAVGKPGATDLHMWISVAVAPDRWIDWDPTVSAPALAHLAIARGLAPDDVTAVAGPLAASGRCRMTSRVAIEQLDAL